MVLPVIIDIYSAKSNDSGTISEFTNRKKIYISTTGTSTPVDYQVMVTIDYESEMDADFADIRFNTTDGDYIDYCIISSTTSTTADIWLELPDTITDPGTDIIYIYYGNNNLNDNSNGNDTFLFFDNFEGTSLDSLKWDNYGVGTITVSNSIITLSPPFSNTLASGIYSKNTGISVNNVLEFRAQFVGSTNNAMIGLSDTHDGTTNIRTDDSYSIFHWQSGTRGNSYINGVVDVIAATKSESYNVWKIINDGSNINVYQNSSYLGNMNTSSEFDSDMYFCAVGYDNASYTGDINIDYIINRKYIANEPTISYGEFQFYNFTNKKLVTIDGSMVTTETGIPLSLNINLPNVGSAGKDVRLFKLDDTPIAREIECINVPNTDDVTIWYPFDTITSTNSQFYVCWGDKHLSEPARDSTYGSEAVWDSNFIGVYHMNQDPSGGANAIKDSTSNNNNGTSAGSMTTTDLIDAPYGKGIDFDGVNDRIGINGLLADTDLTQSGLVVMEYYMDKIYETSNTMMGYGESGSWNNYFQLRFSDGVPYSRISMRGGGGTYPTAISNVNNSGLHYHVCQKDGEDIYYYIDGSLKDSDTTTKLTANIAATRFDIAWLYSDVYAIKAKIYEVRITSDSIRTANYILTTNKNLNNPTATNTTPFYLSFGSTKKQYTQFTRRADIKITTNGSSTPPNYQVKITIPWKTEMQTDFQDIRFSTRTDENIDYWIESSTTSTTATVWIEVPDAITDPGDDTIWMYYGNTTVSDGSNGSNTFIQYRSNETSTYLESLNLVSPYNVVYEIRIKYGVGANIDAGMTNTADMSDDCCLAHTDLNHGIYYYVENENVRTSSGWRIPIPTVGTYYNIKYEVYSGGAKYYRDNVQDGAEFTTNLPNENLGMVIRNTTGSYEQEWAFIRKYIANEPTSSYGIVHHQRKTPQLL